MRGDSAPYWLYGAVIEWFLESKPGQNFVQRFQNGLRKTSRPAQTSRHTASLSTLRRPVCGAVTGNFEFKTLKLQKYTFENKVGTFVVSGLRDDF